MRIDVLTLFPELIDRVCGESIIGRARKAGVLTVEAHNIRDYSDDRRRRVDDTPYGGGMGMLMAAPPVCACYDSVLKLADLPKTKTIYLSPKGRVLTQRYASYLASQDRLILLCGHYEGIDERILEETGAEEISIGDYVLTGGELAACVLIDCVGRLVDGVLSSEECHEIESIAAGMLEYPQYTRPEVFRGRAVPRVLLEGNHEEVRKWRYAEAVKQTKKKRPDLF
ncbi:MAG: tRNA (guanosine(37)-N1)-methyltransferase TrmD [Clostridia bacterium]|nr:tRNA (guanosine(37)-N1)-methyltransferase TrmD [Clostridia bacterium]